MENNKVHFHDIRRVFYDILRDNNSDKYSMTKFATLAILIVLLSTVGISLTIMWQKKEIDHVLIGELIGLILTLLGFKNNFGFSSTKGNQTADLTGNPNLTQNDKPIVDDPANAKQLLTEEIKNIENK